MITNACITVLEIRMTTQWRAAIFLWNLEAAPKTHRGDKSLNALVEKVSVAVR